MLDKKNIEIRPFTPSDYDKVVDILLLSFGSKFATLTNLQKDDLKSYMI